MSETKTRSREFLLEVWKLAFDCINPEILKGRFNDGDDALGIVIEKLRGLKGAHGDWLRANLSLNGEIFRLWFRDIYRNAYEESVEGPVVLCNQLRRLACGQLSRRGHRSLSEAHTILSEDDADPWLIALNDLRKNEATGNN